LRKVTLPFYAVAFLSEVVWMAIVLIAAGVAQAAWTRWAVAALAVLAATVGAWLTATDRRRAPLRDSI
jgi:hypothetical protein